MLRQTPAPASASLHASAVGTPGEPLLALPDPSQPAGSTHRSRGCSSSPAGQGNFSPYQSFRLFIPLPFYIYIYIFYCFFLVLKTKAQSSCGTEQPESNSAPSHAEIATE